MSDRFKITVDEAIGVLPDGDYVHTFIANGMLLGADWSREEVETHIRKAGGASLGGDTAMRMGHGLCLDADRRLFAKHDKDRMAALEAVIAAEPE